MEHFGGLNFFCMTNLTEAKLIRYLLAHPRRVINSNLNTQFTLCSLCSDLHPRNVHNSVAVDDDESAKPMSGKGTHNIEKQF